MFMVQRGDDGMGTFALQLQHFQGVFVLTVLSGPGLQRWHWRWQGWVMYRSAYARLR
jgi:hypothetical protein